jgi:hypothetical protein
VQLWQCPEWKIHLPFLMFFANFNTMNMQMPLAIILVPYNRECEAFIFAVFTNNHLTCQNCSSLWLATLWMNGTRCRKKIKTPLNLDPEKNFRSKIIAQKILKDQFYSENYVFGMKIDKIGSQQFFGNKNEMRMKIPKVIFSMRPRANIYYLSFFCQPNGCAGASTGNWPISPSIAPRNL